ncbi:MAG: CoA transferase [Dehalococcoidia bacterium]|nr:CoA transferase [Dehalococcoidia bacterium]
MPLPLEGIRVADFSWVVAGPYCTMGLALLGAEVIKIESGVHTDLMRRLPPAHKLDPSVDGSGVWHMLNLGKKSVTLDLSQPDAQDLAVEIVRSCDIAIENFAYGVFEHFNLSYERFKEAKPDIIMVRSAGLGRTGPYREFATFGPPLTAYTGLASVTGQDGGAPDRAIAGIWSDHVSGLTSLCGVLLALEHRDRTGEGQVVEYSMAETVAGQIPEAFIEYGCTGVVPGPIGNRDRSLCPHGIYPAAGLDRWIAIVVQSEAEWDALVLLMGSPAQLARPELRQLAARLAAQPEIDAAIAAWTGPQDPFELAARLQAAGISAGNVSNCDELIADPYLHERGFYVQMEHPTVGTMTHAALPWAIEGVTGRNPAHAPLLGEHNWEIFVDWLGMDPERFSELVANGAIR